MCKPSSSARSRFSSIFCIRDTKEINLSHIVTIETQVRDPAAIVAACRRLGLMPLQHGEHRLYASKATGLGVQLPGWRYPVVCDTTNGKLAYDNFNGHWGAQHELNRFMQVYAVEKSYRSQCASRNDPAGINHRVFAARNRFN